MITWFPKLKSDGSLDISQWIDFVVERGAAVGTRRGIEGEDLGKFIGYHVERIERVNGPNPSFPDFDENVPCAFGFSWIGPDATDATAETQTVYRLSAAIPDFPLNTLPWGVVPSGWSNTAPLGTATQDSWMATRTRLRGRISEWEVTLNGERTPVQYHTLYIRDTSSTDGPDAPANTIAWGSTPQGWAQADPGATATDAVWRAQRSRRGVTGVVGAWMVSLFSDKTGGTTPPEPPTTESESFYQRLPNTPVSYTHLTLPTICSV